FDFIASAGQLWPDQTQELELFRKPEDRPRQPPRPCGEWRIALLRIGAAITAIIAIEDAFMGGAARDVVGIALFPVVNVVARRRARMNDEPIKQGNLLIALPQEHVAEQMRQ